MPLLPECGAFRQFQLPREGRHRLALKRQVAVEVGRVQLGGGVEARRIVHAALAAPAVRVPFDRPFDEPGAVAVAIPENPVEVTFELRKRLGQEHTVRRRLIDRRDAEGQHRRLGHLRMAVRRHHMRNQAVRKLLRQHGAQALPRRLRIEMAQSDRVKDRVPEPHLAMRPAVRRRPPTRNPSAGGVDLPLQL